MTPVHIVPEPRIEIGGNLLELRRVGSLAEMTIFEKLSAPSMCELTFLVSADAPDADLGSRLSISIGDAQDAAFEGYVAAIELTEGAERELRIRAYDALDRLRKQQPLRMHTHVTVVDLAREMAEPLGITVKSEETWPAWERLAQYRQTDFELLAAAAARAGAYFHLRGGILRISPLAGSGPTTKLRFGREVLRLSVERTGYAASNSVRALGWKPGNVSWQELSAASSSFGRDAVRTLTGAIVETEEQLSAFAGAEAERRAARKRVIRGMAEGGCGLAPGMRIEVEDASEGFAGVHAVTWTRHRLERRLGFVTEFGSAPPEHNSPEAFSAAADEFFATPAVVSRIDDPDRLGRVCATLPAIGNLESGWLCTLAPGAGSAKGLMATPDIGDTVLALVSAFNPAIGIVLGSLYGGQGMPDTGIEDGAVKRFTLLTPQRQKMMLDDSTEQVRLENSAGTYLDFSRSSAVFHAANDLTIRAPGKRIIVEADQIEFRRR